MARPPTWRRPDEAQADSGESIEGLGIEWPDVEEDVDDWSDEGAGPRPTRGLIRRAAAKVAAGFARVGRLSSPWFLLVLGVGLILLKPVLMALSWAAELGLPEALAPLLPIRPLEWLAASAGSVLAEGLGGGHGVLSGVMSVLFLALLFPLLSTFVAQLVPLHLLKGRIGRRWIRVLLSLIAMGILYTFAFGRLGFFVSGVGLGLPLVWAFEARLGRGTVRRAFLLTCGGHALANGAIVVLLLCAGAL